MGLQYFNETLLNVTSQLPIGASGKYILIENCKDYAHDLAHYNNAYLGIIAVCVILLFVLLWKIKKMRGEKMFDEFDNKGVDVGR